MRRTLGPSLIRTEGIPSLGMGVVFHQFGAPRRAIFSSTLSRLTRSGIEASRNCCVMVAEVAQASSAGVFLTLGFYEFGLTSDEWEDKSNAGDRSTGRKKHGTALHDVKQQQTKLDLGLSLDAKAVKESTCALTNVLRIRNNDD